LALVIIGYVYAEAFMFPLRPLDPSLSISESAAKVNNCGGVPL